MAGNKVTIQLTDEQQKQIMSATGRNITELNIDAASLSQLSESDLESASGGIEWTYDKV